MAERALVYDCVSGISGDMHIGAMLDLGVPEDHLRAALDRLPLAREFELVVARDKRKGISGTKATVQLHDGIDKPHRHLSTIKDIITTAGYNTRVEKTACQIFQHIAEAEAKIHDIDIERVHFHEVGATDSIVDVVAAAICLDHINPDRVFCGAVEMGSGTVRCAHGVMPVPAPATAEILKGVPCHYGRVNGEATTPTGAAILKTAVTTFGAPGALTVAALGYGVGQKDFEIANVLRVSLGELEREPVAVEANVEVVCNIDDMSPEAFQPLLDALFAAGAKDAYLTPVIMKKSRPGTEVTVLATLADKDSVIQTLFAASTTIGVRTRDVTKRMLPREEITVTTPFGAVRAKVVDVPGGTARFKTEHDDLVRLSQDSGVAYLTLKGVADDAVAKWLDEQKS